MNVVEVEKHWELCWVLNNRIHARQQIFSLAEAEREYTKKISDRSVYKFQILEVTKKVIFPLKDS